MELTPNGFNSTWYFKDTSNHDYQYRRVLSAEGDVVWEYYSRLWLDWMECTTEESSKLEENFINESCKLFL